MKQHLKKKHICWITATYFIDVDLPVVPELMETFDIDWIIVSTQKNYADDISYIKSKTGKPITMLKAPARFYAPESYRFYRDMILKIKNGNYDAYYFDISDMLFLFPLIKHHLPLDKVIVATHNVSVPKGARLAPLARLSMNYIVKNFRHFQTFSLNQMDVLRSRRPDADIFYSPLMLKDYGSTSTGGNDYKPPVKFLFFGNIVKYKRLDVLLKAVNILLARGHKDFKIYITGYCNPAVWQKDYLPMILHPDMFHLDIRRIPNDKVAAYFQECHYFVMPYQDIAQSGAMTVALNYNMPVIASDLPTFHEFLTADHDSYFFKAADPEALADKMEICIRNSRQEYYRLKDNLSKTVKEKLSPESILSNYRHYLSYFPNAHTR